MIHKIKNKECREMVEPLLCGMSVSDYNIITDAINKSKDVHELTQWLELRPRFNWLVSIIPPIYERSYA